MVFCVAQERLEEEINKDKEEEIAIEKDVQVITEEKLEEINLRSNPQEQRPILISSRLSEKDKSNLILLLKEFKDVFAWDYNEMLGLDPRLVVHTLNVDPESKPVA